MKIKNTSKGITLIALVITIIVLLILAGISIATLIGDNGILTKARKAKEEQLIAQYKEEINLIIAEEIAERKIEAKPELMIESLDTRIRKKEWVKEIYKLNDDQEEQTTFEASTHLLVESKEYYEFLIEVDENSNTARIVETVKGTNEKYTITYHPNEGTGKIITKQVKAGFLIRLEECNYSREKFMFVGWCEKKEPDSEAIPYAAGSKYQVKGNVTLYATWESTVATITFNSNDGTGRTETVEVAKEKNTKLPENKLERDGYEFVTWNTEADGSGKTYEEGDIINTTEDITLYIVWEKQREAPEYWKITKKTDSEWYNYGNAKINQPKLTGKMKPIKYIGENQTGNKWANAITMDGSMWVWIPRYAYKITSGYHSATDGTIEVAFLDTDNHFLNGETGILLTDPNKVTYTGDAQNEWLVHPAFTSSAVNGGGFGELEGLWVGKFETTGVDNSNPYVTTNNYLFGVFPGVNTANGGNLNNLYQSAKNSKFEEEVTLNSHMAKNSEWGAIVYLGHSRYGTNGLEVKSVVSATKSGGTNVVKDIYTTNKKQSTTWNAFGIYDINGNAIEAVASYTKEARNGGRSVKCYGNVKRRFLWCR